MSKAFFNLLNKGARPIPYFIVKTPMGERAFAAKELAGSLFLAGFVSATGYLELGSARVISISPPERAISPANSDIYNMYGTKQMTNIEVVLDNSDRYFSRLLVHEPFISRPCALFVGFETVAIAEHLRLFNGTITEITIKDKVLVVEADER